MNARRLALIGLAALALSACGGKSEAEKEREQKAPAVSPAVCDASELAGYTGLPEHFPEPDGVTYKKTKKAGPTRIVAATYDGDLDSAYAAYGEVVVDSGYNVLFKEKEEDDAEISYEGEGTTGQIALRNVCDDPDKVVVRITSRPQ
jgi:hypothetical protein